MPKPTTEDEFYYLRVKVILRILKRQWKDEESTQPFSNWLELNREAVGTEFLNDINSYMGMPDVNDL